MNDQLPAPDLLGTLVGYLAMSPESLIRNAISLFQSIG